MQAELTAALQNLKDDSGLRQKISAAARQYIAENHSWEMVAARYAEFIHSAEQSDWGNSESLTAAIGSLPAMSEGEREQLLRVVSGNPGIGRIIWG
jgi:hypothetical protein